MEPTRVGYWWRLREPIRLGDKPRYQVVEVRQDGRTGQLVDSDGVMVTHKRVGMCWAGQVAPPAATVPLMALATLGAKAAGELTPAEDEAIDRQMADAMAMLAYALIQAGWGEAVPHGTT